MSDIAHHLLPRLYIESAIAPNATLPIPADALHYLQNVLRMKDGSQLRIFNEQSGEFLVNFTQTGKKQADFTVVEQLRAPNDQKRRRILVFSVIKKDALGWLLEKATELGVTDLQPVLSQRTVMRDFNEVRARKQVIEAAEQCERLDVPNIHPLLPLKTALTNWQDQAVVFAALESGQNSKPVSQTGDAAIVIGPEGGFTEEEMQFLRENTQSITLGDNILRAETAAIVALALIN